jgi:integrase
MWEFVKANPKQRRVLLEEEEIRLLNACRQSQSSYLYCIVLLGLTTGARKSEILNLTWDSIDFENRTAFIKDSKNGKPRRIGLVETVINELKHLYAFRDPNKPLIFASKTAFGKIDIKKGLAIRSYPGKYQKLCLSWITLSFLFNGGEK